MAANCSSRGITILGKRVANRIWNFNSPSPPLPSTLRRGAAYSSKSVYDKNREDEIESGEDVIQATQSQSDKYWAPHPQTGVFGPPGASASASGGEQPPSRSDLLEEKAWFRPTSLEDLEKPHSLP